VTRSAKEILISILFCLIPSAAANVTGEFFVYVPTAPQNSAIATVEADSMGIDRAGYLPVDFGCSAGGKQSKGWAACGRNSCQFTARGDDHCQK
jgi:hypothetical protein